MSYFYSGHVQIHVLEIAREGEPGWYTYLLYMYVWAGGFEAQSLVAIYRDL